jgi:GPH family glycoside/pentoside/hexuronide:cation symporter
LGYVHFQNTAHTQTPLAQEGILWLVCIIPALLLVIAMCIISKYELDDATIERINREIEARKRKE